MQLLLSNARSFNGESSEIAIHAEKLVAQLMTALNHERKHFGIQGDVINVLEEAIKKKYALFRALLHFNLIYFTFLLFSSLCCNFLF